MSPASDASPDDSGSERPAVFTIDPGASFADALAAGLLERQGDDPLDLARVLILLPTRRACRTLREAFLRQGGGRPLLLPRMQPIGDVDEDEMLLSSGGGPGEPDIADDLALPPAIAAPRRQLLLTKLILARGNSGGRAGGESRGDTRGDSAMSADQAAWLAAELARLLDRVQTERLSFEALDDLVPETFAAHWQQTLEFLKIVTEAWPGVLAEEGAMDPGERRDRLISARAEAWRRSPPPYPVIAAGSTGSIPATADLLAVVAGLPEGSVVLPGLDRASDDATWEAVLAAPTHPQHGLARILDRLEISRNDVRDWPVPPDALPDASRSAARAAFVAEAMRPAETTDSWRDMALDAEAARAALAGVTRVDCPTPREEAGIVALVMREALQEPGRTAALVTADRGLARRVAAELRRWDVEIDDSAGQPLAATPPGAFLRLVAAMAADDAAPVPLLAMLKHPLAAGGSDPAAFRANARRLETTILRGGRPAPGFAGLRRALEAAPHGAALPPCLDALEARAALLMRLAARRKASLGALLDAHVGAAELLAADSGAADGTNAGTAEGAGSGAARLWAGEAGEAAARFFSDARKAAEDFGEIEIACYPAMLEALMAGIVVRPRHGRHPRLNIWGPLEARLQRADVTILGGLNEATWPVEPSADPWMSRPMQIRFGLPEPARRIGLAAHDFVQGFAAPRVVLTRAARVEGAPTVPSRWLLRLETVLAGLGLVDREHSGGAPWTRGSWLDWQHALDRPDRVAPVARPAPRPPVAARPRTLSVTRIEAWMQDPYGIYARHVLKLRALDPLDAPLGPAERGTFVHKALQRFVLECGGKPPADALACLLAIGDEEFRALGDRTGVRAFWWPRFERVAAWVVGHDDARREEIAASAAEIVGALEIEAPGGAFTVTARADRIDRLADGRLEIVDYKTGAPPSKKRVEAGYAPQLPLEAAIARAGGFDGIEASPVARVAYWRLGGGDPAGKVIQIDDGDELAEEAVARLRQLVALFDEETTPYAAEPRADNPPRFNDYAHLARLLEWSVAGGEEES